MIELIGSMQNADLEHTISHCGSIQHVHSMSTTDLSSTHQGQEQAELQLKTVMMTEHLMVTMLGSAKTVLVKTNTVVTEHTFCRIDEA
eukprot:2949757-Rhodomonas_salina.2